MAIRLIVCNRSSGIPVHVVVVPLCDSRAVVQYLNSSPRIGQGPVAFVTCLGSILVDVGRCVDGTHVT